MQNLRLAVEWIAQNDNAGNGDSVSEIQEYMTTKLISDVFGQPIDHIARRIALARQEAGLKVGASIDRLV